MQIEIITKDSQLKKLIPEWLKRDQLGVDTETEGFNRHAQRMCMVQVNDGKRLNLIDASKTDINLLKPVFESTDVRKLIHNSIFDCTWLKHEFDFRTRNIYDTEYNERISLGVVLPWQVPAGWKKADLEAFKPLYATNLSRCLERRGLPSKLEFEEFTYGKKWTDSQIEYSARDIEFLPEIAESQERTMQQLGLEMVSQLENRVAEVFYQMSWHGFNLDTDGWRKYSTEHEKMRAQAIKSLEKLAPEVQNWNAPGQVSAFFGCKYIKEVEALAHSSNAATFNALNKKQKEAYKAWQISRALKTVVNTFGTVWLDKNVINGRVYCDYTQIVNTGRVSCDSPNLQNIPVKLNKVLGVKFKHRKFFIPDKGFEFAIADFSGQELAIMAIGSQEPVWLATLRAGKDLHQVCADLMSKASGREVPRRMAKTLNFTMGYGGGKATVVVRLKSDYDIDISEEEAQEMINIYFATFPKLKRFLDDNGKLAVRDGCTYSFAPFNRLRVLALETEDWRKRNIGKNSPIQGTGADMTKLAMCYMEDRLRASSMYDRDFIIHQLHDELVVQFYNPKISETKRLAIKELMRSSMDEACTFILGEPLSAPSITVQNNWGKAD
jgi:DNA polymerase I-like protein with 3'-5' exonuclease and polymerase domains